MTKLVELIALSELNNYLPSKSGGKKVNRSTVYSWCSVGIRGVKLKFVQLGGTRYSTLADVERFMEQSTALSQPATTTATAKSRAQSDTSAATEDAIACGERIAQKFYAKKKREASSPAASNKKGGTKKTTH